VVPVSVVIPCFRSDATIERAVLSVQQQAWLPTEIILVDDASGDVSLSKLRELAAASTVVPIRVIALDRNVGAASARNVGWNLAQGDYIAFLDSDDAWLPGKIQTQYGYMQQHPSVHATGHLHLVATVDDPLPEVTIPSAVSSRQIGRWEILLHNPFITPSMMVQRKLGLRFREGRRFMEDHLLWQEMVLSGLSVERLALPLAVIHKAIFGESGLSAQLVSMQRGELENYRVLRELGHTSRAIAILLRCYSNIKFLRRLMLVASRQIFRAVLR
jgi:glycosyltransferase involved in cell wall biosynthesis